MKQIWQTIQLSAVTPEPWRNGGGTTQTLFQDALGDDWRIRCSVATIAKDGAFSNFAGVTRWFAVLGGAGVELTIDGIRHRKTPASQPLQFDGAAHTQCRLIAGETRDFNLMLQGCAGSIQTISQQHTDAAVTGQWLAVYSHTHETTLHINGLQNGEKTQLPPQHLAWLHCTIDCTIVVNAEHALWMQATV